MDPLSDVPRPTSTESSKYLDSKEIANVDSEGRCIVTLYKFLYVLLRFCLFSFPYR